MTSGSIVYPMVNWEDRSTTIVDETGVTNNYYEEDGDFDATALALTGIFCFLGGCLVQAAIQYFLNKKDSSTPLAATNNAKDSSAL